MRWRGWENIPGRNSRPQMGVSCCFRGMGEKVGGWPAWVSGREGDDVRTFVQHSFRQDIVIGIYSL